MSNIKNIFFDTIKDLNSYTHKIVISIIIVYFLTGIYTVKQNEIAMVKRFGKIVSSNVKPGISYSLPWPIDNIKKIKIKKMQSMILDDFVERPSKNSNAYKFIETTGLKSYIITGDDNIVNIKLNLKYLITNPVNYENKFKDIKNIINSISNNIIIKYISSESINNILIDKRSEMRFILKREIQKELNKLHTGIQITFLDLENVAPPSLILHFFNDVINANIDKNKLIREAEGYKTNILTQARIKSKEIIQGAESQAKETINKATAEEKRYQVLYQEYKKSPKRFYKTKYLEFISDTYQYLEAGIVTPNKGGKIRYTIDK
jgi:membrane protease subunit HflK